MSLKSKERVINYLHEHYYFEFELVKMKEGKNAWPADRQEDEFIFHDVTNEIYFQILQTFNLY